MSVQFAKFNKQDRPEFFKELNKRVNAYFKENNRSRHANFSMKFKTLFMLLLYFVPYGLMLAGITTSFSATMLLWVIMGFGMSGIGLSIMHDANHGSYSDKKWVNNMLGYVINFVGGYHVNWKIQHNVLHHSFTNIHELDEDLNTPVMRFSPRQERKGYYKYQAFYAPLFYSIMTLFWCTARDFIQLKRYNKNEILAAQGYAYSSTLAKLISLKVMYLFMFLALPLLVSPLLWWQTLLGFLCMHFICGLILALIFQPAHVLEETEFFENAVDSSMENNWAIHQMRTTANFANDSILFSWFIGGLNFQIEHHLFPNVCHVHYKSISGIVKETAREFNVPYHQHKTFFGALKSHFTLLDQLGTGEYDRQLAA